MSTHKHIDRICCVVILLALVLTVVFWNAESLGIQAASRAMGYETRLFDTAEVHTIDIVMDDWEGFLETCTDEEYVLCDLVIDGEAYTSVAIRAKGNTSLSQVASYGNDRYSFKVEFDHYDSTKTYHGLDKLCLNNIIQDNTYMKDYLTYQMMNAFGVSAPLCSFVYLTVNGEDWGLYLAVEGVEEAFLERNYGSDYGELYKPDSMSMGGGRGNGADFDLEGWMESRDDGDETDSAMPDFELPELPDFQPGEAGAQLPAAPPDDAAASEEAATAGESGQSAPTGGGRQQFGGMGGGTMGSDDVSLVYTDDDYESYANIFDNAKTDITDADRDRLIDALETLNQGSDPAAAVDVDQVIRYFVVHNFVLNFDSYTGSMIHNYYLYEADGVLSMIPWDYNLAFGGFQGAQDATALVNYPIDTPVSGGSVESRPMLAWIFASEEYTALYHQYFAEFLETYFESGYFSQMMEEVYGLIAPYVEQDPTKFCTYEEFEAGFETLETFCLLRAESIAGQLDGTIPATEEGQAADSTALIDASEIDVTAMGSMNAGGGMGGRGGMGNIGGRNPFDAGSDFSGGMTPGGETASATDGGADTQATQSQTTAEALPDGETRPAAAPTGDLDQGLLQTTAMDAGGDTDATGDTIPADDSTDSAATEETAPADDTTDSAASEAETTPAEDTATDAAAPSEMPDAAAGEIVGTWGGAGDRFSLDDGGQRPTDDEMPWQQGTESTAAAEPESLVLLIACVGVLAAGILAAALYRRRG